MLFKRQSKKENSSDDSEDENIAIRTGKVPKVWYDKEEHLGYNVKGEKVTKPKSKTQMDRIIEAEENPDFWRYVYDEMNNEEVYLTDEQLQLVKKIKDKMIIDDHIRNTDYTFEVEINEMETHHETIKKRNFLPSKMEQKKINKIVRGIKNGFIKFDDDTKPKNSLLNFLNDVQDTWQFSQSEQFRLPNLLPPKLPLPGHEASFNPLPELFKEEIKPQVNLRSLGSSTQLIKDQFERLLSLYLAPRVEKKKVHMKKEDLLQELPSLQDLKPFPTKCVIKSLTSFSHATIFDISPDDAYIIVGDAFGNVIIMHTLTSVIIHRIKIEGGSITALKFLSRALILVSSEKCIELIALKFNTHEFEEACDHFEAIAQSQYVKDMKINETNPNSEFDFFFPGAYIKNDIVNFRRKQISKLMSIKIKNNRILHLDIHHKKDFLVITTAKSDDSRKIDVISLSKCSNTVIHVKAHTKIQKCLFHNSKPLIFIMTQTHVFLFELQKQAMKKKLISGSSSLTDMALHKTGDHLIVSTADSKVLWFDLDSGQFPYKKMKVHSGSVNSCAFSPAFQLFVSASSDGEIVLQHSMIDLESFGYPTITPIKVLINQFSGNKSIPQARFFNTKYFLAAIGVDGQVMIWA